MEKVKETSVKCVNPRCSKLGSLTCSSLHVRRFFGVKRHSVGHQLKVCEDCMNAYEQHNKELVRRVKDRIPVLTGSEWERRDSEEKTDDAMDVNEVVESFDEEICIEVESDEEYYEVSADIEEQIIAALDKLDFRFQAKEAIKCIDNKLNEHAERFKEVDAVWNHLDDEYREIRREVEELQGIVREEVEEVEFIDTYPPVLAAMLSTPPIATSTTSKFPPYYAKQLSLVSGQLSPTDSSDVIPLARIDAVKPRLPPPGPVVRQELLVGMRAYAMKASYFGIWYKARILEIKSGFQGDAQYKVRYEPKRMSQQTRVLSGKHLAYIDPPTVTLTMGMRVIARYKDEYWNQSNSMYAGIIAEPPKAMNNYRYLVFFDDGYAQYVQHGQVHLVCEVSSMVWDDIQPDSREFIRSYLQRYPERPMVKLQKNQVVKTEWNGKWWIARVVDVDASLVKMYFDADKRTEWIYRGSTRLGPLYSELANAEANKAAGKIKRHNLGLMKKKNAPYVEYTRGLDEPPKEDVDNDKGEVYQFNVDDDNIEILDDRAAPEPERPKQVAKKQTAAPVQPARINVAKKSTSLASRENEASSTGRSYHSQNKLECDGSIVDVSLRRTIQRRQFTLHTCGSQCFESDNPDKFKGQNPLLIPMLSGWERQICKYRTSKRAVLYRTPCGRRLRDIDEVHYYLTVTQSQLSVDLFCFDHTVHCYTEFVPSKAFCLIKDISYGKENVPVSCVNSINRQYPEYVGYSARRFAGEGVHLNVDPDFLVGCDCTDDCSDPSKCFCHQLTLSMMSDQYRYSEQPPGYQHRRLHEQIITGIYECNPKCRCRSQCLNRVAQNGLQLRLQVFRTEKRGWGLRCLDDIPQGGFICIYAGQLLTDQKANEDGKQYGDEYLAELDYIEVVERLKEGYESDVIEPESATEKTDVAKEESNPEEKPSTTGRESGDEVEAEKSESSKDTSDSDFELDDDDYIGPIGPRRLSSRNKDKGKKSQHKEGGSQSKGERKKVEKMEVVTNDANKDIDEPKTPAEEEKMPHGNNSGFLHFKHNFYKIDLPPLSPNTIKKVEESHLIRKPRVHRSASLECGFSSEDDTVKQESVSSKVSEISTLAMDSEMKNDDDSTSMDTDVSSDTNKVRQPSKFSVSIPEQKSSSVQDVTDLTADSSFNRVSIRHYFGEEYCYIMDAKSDGNIGRYLNHGCSPNVFVQNVFVDTHDPRFPWVAFFAMQYIRAGTELTWDYNYDVGSVPNKVLYCYCGSSECRGRLL